MHEHDVVPVGSVHIQVDLPDVGGYSSGSGLQFLKTATKQRMNSSRSAI